MESDEHKKKGFLMVRGIQRLESFNERRRREKLLGFRVAWSDCGFNKSEEISFRDSLMVEINSLVANVCVEFDFAAGNFLLTGKVFLVWFGTRHEMVVDERERELHFHSLRG
jgi:hypothetical protein